MCNDAWLSFWSSSSCCTLTRVFSDHHPLLLVLKRGNKTYPSSFKFHQMWLDHPDYSRLISEVWNRSFVGCPMSILVQNFKALKSELKTRNKSVFGYLHLNVEKALEEVDRIQSLIDVQGFSDDLKVQEQRAQITLQQALSSQEQFWKDKARIN